MAAPRANSIVVLVPSGAEEVPALRNRRRKSAAVDVNVNASGVQSREVVARAWRRYKLLRLAQVFLPLAALVAAVLIIENPSAMTARFHRNVDLATGLALCILSVGTTIIGLTWRDWRCPRCGQIFGGPPKAPWEHASLGRTYRYFLAMLRPPKKCAHCGIRVYSLPPWT